MAYQPVLNSSYAPPYKPNANGNGMDTFYSFGFIESDPERLPSNQPSFRDDPHSPNYLHPRDQNDYGVKTRPLQPNGGFDPKNLHLNLQNDYRSFLKDKIAQNKVHLLNDDDFEDMPSIDDI